MSTGPSTTLADLLTPLFRADPHSAMRTSLRIWSDDELDDGLAHGGQRWLRWWSVDFFFPPHFCETAMLEEGVSDHCHERVTMKAMPGPSLEVVEAEFLFQLLMSLLQIDRALIVAAKVRKSIPAGRLAR